MSKDSEPVSPADTPDYEAIRLRAQSQLSHFATSSGSGITGVPSCDRCGKPRNRWDEPCAYLPYAAAHLLAEDVLTLLAVGERDKAEIERLERSLRESNDLRRVQRLSHDSLQAERVRDGRQIAQLTERLIDAQQLLARLEYLRHGSGARRPMDGEGIEHFACPTCGWPQGGHPGPGRCKGNDENTHEEGCSLYAALHGEPAPRLLKNTDRPTGAVLADEEDAHG